MSDFLVTNAELNIDNKEIVVNALKDVFKDIDTVISINPQMDNKTSVVVKKKDIQYTYLVDRTLIMDALNKYIKDEDFHKEILKQNKDLVLDNFTYKFYSNVSCNLRLTYGLPNQ